MIVLSLFLGHLLAFVAAIAVFGWLADWYLGASVTLVVFALVAVAVVFILIFEGLWAFWSRRALFCFGSW